LLKVNIDCNQPPYFKKVITGIKLPRVKLIIAEPLFCQLKNRLHVLDFLNYAPWKV